MTPDCDLLRQYLKTHDEAAFAEVVRRYVNLVYAVALRMTHGDTALAEDVTQAAFTELARKAVELTDRATLAGWLHTTARFIALRGVRAEQRRRSHEQEASAMNNPTDTATKEISWEQLRPLLDEAVGELDEADREAVLLRFFQDKSHREVGEVLGLSENTARMRVERALDKLRGQFSRRGVTTTAALLITTLGAHGASTAAPTGFAGTVAGKSLAGVAKTGPTHASSKMTGLMAKPKGLLVAIVILVVVGIIIYTSPFGKHAPVPQVVLPKIASQVEAPRAPPVTPIAVAVGDVAKKDGSPNSNDLGEISFVTPQEQFDGKVGKTYPLSSGLIFVIRIYKINADGSLDLAYGTYEKGKPLHMRSAGSYNGVKTITALNTDYNVKVTAGTPIYVTLMDGETVTFTPIASKLSVNSLGVLNFMPDVTQKFALLSGKILTLTLTISSNEANREAQQRLIDQYPNRGFQPLSPGNEINISENVYPSEQAFEANEPIRGGGGTAPKAGQEVQYDVGDGETVTYTPQY